ncbi:MAG: hypothetical protein BAJATHORv1_60088 [Candidatus Thorarchaeota archaeon]|nr:MAG: hypothetical protein BAJATHORv1_60088 [Candidatus Thorarchaeota archaeon]
MDKNRVNEKQKAVKQSRACDTTMTDQFIETLAKGLKAKYTHVDPIRALQAISIDKVVEKPNPQTRSIFELLHHVVLWQNLTIEALQGHDVIWPKKGEDWPKSNAVSKEGWKELVEEFTQGLERAEIVAEMLESETPIPAWENMSASNGLLVLVQHNSYHMGQIVLLRQVLGIWPPES